MSSITRQLLALLVACWPLTGLTGQQYRPKPDLQAFSVLDLKESKSSRYDPSPSDLDIGRLTMKLGRFMDTEYMSIDRPRSLRRGDNVTSWHLPFKVRKKRSHTYRRPHPSKLTPSSTGRAHSPGRQPAETPPLTSTPAQDAQISPRVHTLRRSPPMEGPRFALLASLASHRRMRHEALVLDSGWDDLPACTQSPSNAAALALSGLEAGEAL
ncbi:uncharacterized protein LOC122375751 [Amphibalanus amphitrite]|uniref:uncharacterized protein LOC122375751 n=1 Tax=Amphibalanus amphitrite TaxID=1232801 RepID=UPI001C911A34|nr:uncharacterized protein LOC122375751 [Amphibalanus amphitrite]